MDIIDTVSESLSKNGMRVFRAGTRAEVVPIIEKFIPRGASAGSGGSATLLECGVIDFLRSGGFTYYDRLLPGVTAEETEEVFRKEKHADFFFSSSNAVTLSGELYNVDGRGNRVAAIAHGPKNVVIVAGRNKIVKDLNEAALRVKTVAAPKNAVRLKINTFCAVNGKCASLCGSGDAGGMTAGCSSAGRICCHYLISGFQREAGRVTVILVNEDLGY